MTRPARAAAAVLGALAAVALLADLLAADLPLAVRVDGATHLLPCLFHPAALRGDDHRTLARRAEWIVGTPIGHGPLSSRPGGELRVLAPPSADHWLGTDDRGRDVAARLVHGTRTALLVGGLAVALALVVGLALGLVMGMSRAADLALGRVVEVALTFPVLFLLLALQGTLGSPSLVEVAAAIALVRWPDIARLTRAEVLRLGASPHVEAARAVGASRLRIAWREILPLAIGPALVSSAIGLGQAALVEAGLTFLGCGVPPPSPSWGELLAQAQASGLRLPLLLPPTLAIALLLLSASAAASDIRRRLARRDAA